MSVQKRPLGGSSKPFGSYPQNHSLEKEPGVLCVFHCGHFCPPQSNPPDERKTCFWRNLCEEQTAMLERLLPAEQHQSLHRGQQERKTRITAEPYGLEQMSEITTVLPHRPMTPFLTAPKPLTHSCFKKLAIATTSDARYSHAVSEFPVMWTCLLSRFHRPSPRRTSASSSDIVIDLVCFLMNAFDPRDFRLQRHIGPSMLCTLGSLTRD